jgi:hypothetical protein
MHRGFAQKHRSQATLAAACAAIHSASGFFSTKDADTANLNKAGSSEGVI